MINIQSFGTTLLQWHQGIDRELPWKETQDPYKIWISEVVMQQTRIAQGLGYYNRIVDALPTVQKMSEASEDEILYLWKGLGYYSRARNMHKAAQKVVKEHKGVFPDTYKELLSLPGVGPYTAAAIASFAYQLPYAVLDGNVFRVLSRYFGIATPIDSTQGKKEFSALSQQCLGAQSPSDYNQAIMDFGALQCKPKSPDCQACPMQEQCVAYQNDTVALLPIKEKKIKRRERNFYFFQISDGSSTLIERRGEGDIWQGLYQLPMIEIDKKSNVQGAILQFIDRHDLINLEVEINPYTTTQKLTHQTINATIIKVAIEKTPSTYQKVKNSDLLNYAYPILIENYLRLYLKPSEAF